MGHEFTSLVLALLQVGGHPSKATAELIEQVQNRKATTGSKPTSLSCQNCPDVVRALNLAAVLNPRIQHVAIDGALFGTKSRSVRSCRCRPCISTVKCSTRAA